MDEENNTTAVRASRNSVDVDVDDIDIESHVKWQIGRSLVDKDFIQYITIYTLIFIIACTSLANLTMQEERSELWASLLSMMIGVIMPQPKYKNKNEHNRRNRQQRG